VTRFSRVAIALHWLIAAAIFGTFALGLYMHELPLSPTKLRLYSYHKWIGVTIFLLVLARIAWRLAHPAPALPDMPRWQKFAAHLSHVLLYLLTLAVPLSGWLFSSASGLQTVYFGVLPIPDLLAKNKATAEMLKAVHYYLNMTMLALVVLHVAAALKHHFADRDDVLARMLPLVRPRS
jgi:cytochrome b561